jgi:hypothetical protein
MNDDRKSMGTPKEGVLIPVAPSLAEMPAGYADMRDAIITKIKESRVRFAVQVNTALCRSGEYGHDGTLLEYRKRDSAPSAE